MNNLFSFLPEVLESEAFDPILETAGLKLERIVSLGQATPEGEWLRQAQAEWVVLLKGSAAVRLQGDDHLFEMLPGDYLCIPANTSHRVEWTDAYEKTVWLALHYQQLP